MNKLNTTIFCLVIVLLFSISTTTNAQEWDDDIRNWDSYPLSYGFGLGYKAGVNYVKPATGLEVAVGYNQIPDIIALVSLPLSKSSFQSFDFRASISNYSYVIKQHKSKLEPLSTITYLSFTPTLNLNGFIAGFNIGVPLFASNVNTMTTKSSDISPNSTERLNLMFSVLIGGMFPIYSDKDGRLNIFLNGEFSFMDILKDKIEGDILENDEENKFAPRLAAIQIGFNYVVYIK